MVRIAIDSGDSFDDKNPNWKLINKNINQSEVLYTGAEN